MMASVNSDLDPDMHCVDGVWLPAMLTEDYIKQMKGFKINKDDIIVTGYPRTGKNFIFTQKAFLLRPIFKRMRMALKHGKKLKLGKCKQNTNEI